MADTKIEAKPATDPTADALKEIADKQAKIKALKAEAKAKYDAAVKAQAEAEAVLYADWGPGKSGTRPVKIPHANFVSGAQPKVNGRELVGIKEMTYDAYRAMKHQLTYREWQEECAKRGYFKGVQVMDPLSRSIRMVDDWNPAAEGLAGVDYKG